MQSQQWCPLLKVVPHPWNAYSLPKIGKIFVHDSGHVRLLLHIVENLLLSRHLIILKGITQLWVCFSIQTVSFVDFEPLSVMPVLDNNLVLIKVTLSSLVKNFRCGNFIFDTPLHSGLF